MSTLPGWLRQPAKTTNPNTVEKMSPEGGNMHDQQFRDSIGYVSKVRSCTDVHVRSPERKKYIRIICVLHTD